MLWEAVTNFQKGKITNLKWKISICTFKSSILISYLFDRWKWQERQGERKLGCTLLLVFYCFFFYFFVFFLFSDDVHTKESFVGRDSLQGKNFLNTLLATLSYPGRSSILLLWHTVHKRPLNTRLIYNSNNINQLTDRIKNMPKT